MLRSLLFSLVLVFELVFELATGQSRAFACDDVAVATESSSCVAGASFGARAGVWFPKERAGEVVRKLSIYPELELQMARFSELATACEGETRALRTAAQDLRVERAYLQKQLEASIKDAHTAREELASGARWYKSPVFWGITMFIAGAAIQHACCSQR